MKADIFQAISADLTLPSWFGHQQRKRVGPFLEKRGQDDGCFVCLGEEGFAGLLGSNYDVAQ